MTKCPNCGTSIYGLTKDAEKLLNMLGHTEEAVIPDTKCPDCGHKL